MSLSSASFLRSHADMAWKHALDVYFTLFMQFFYPDIAMQIDWTIVPTMLDKELRNRFS